MDQSPKAQRQHAPGERYDDDGLPYTESGGQVRQQGPSGDRGPVSPSGLDFGPRGNYASGVVAADDISDSVAAHVQSAEWDGTDEAGSPGYASKSDVEHQRGGVEEQFTNSRGGNS